MREKRRDVPGRPPFLTSTLHPFSKARVTSMMLGLSRSAATIVAAAACVFGLACSKTTADDHFRRANEFAESSQVREAIVEYRAALQEDHKRADIRLRLADAYFRVGDLRGVLTESVKAADLLPKDVSAQVRAGNLLLLARAFEDAKTRANSALALEPTNAEAMVLLGNVLAGLRDFDGALARYQEAAVLNPEAAIAYQSVGAIHGIRGNRTEAEASFRKAVDVAPQSISARMGLANFLWSAGRPAEAEEALKAAFALDPSELRVNRALATFYLATNRMADAETYVQTIARSADTTLSILSLADFYAMSRRYDDAAKVLRELSTRKDGFAGAMTRLAAIDERNGQRAQALSKLHDVVAKHPKEMPARLLTARLLMAEGKRDEALEQATFIVGEGPTSPVAT